LRRWVCFNDLGKTLEQSWTGLGYMTDYKPAIQEGLMDWIHGKYQPRVMDWLHLTPKGVRIVQYWIDNGYGKRNGYDPENYRVPRDFMPPERIE